MSTVTENKKIIKKKKRVKASVGPFPSVLLGRLEKDGMGFTGDPRGANPPSQEKSVSLPVTPGAKS